MAARLAVFDRLVVNIIPQIQQPIQTTIVDPHHARYGQRYVFGVGIGYNNPARTRVESDAQFWSTMHIMRFNTIMIMNRPMHQDRYPTPPM